MTRFGRNVFTLTAAMAVAVIKAFTNGLLG